MPVKQTVVKATAKDLPAGIKEDASIAQGRDRVNTHHPRTSETFRVAGMNQVQIENMAHALLFDIGALNDVIHKLVSMDEEEDVTAFFDYYSARINLLLKEDAAREDIRTLLDLGEWRLSTRNSVDDYYNMIVERLDGGISPTPAQLDRLLEESAMSCRANYPTRGEVWLPKIGSRHTRAHRQMDR